jgi:hypothetical protein
MGIAPRDLSHRAYGVLAGGALMANCLARRDRLSAALGTVGFGLLMRGVTDRDMKSLNGEVSMARSSITRASSTT